MNEIDKTKEELLAELGALRRQGAELEVLQNQLRSREEDLRLSEERFRTFADSTYDWEAWRSPDGKYIYVSPSCERITGYRSEEFLADPSLTIRILHPEDQTTAGKHLMENSALQGVFQVDFRITTKAGEERWISHYCQGAFGADGEWLGRRASNRDVSMKKRAEIELRRVNRALNVLGESRQAMAPARDEKKFLAEVSRMIIDVGGYRLAWIGFAEDDEMKSVRPVAQAGFEDGYLEKVDISWAETPKGKGPTGTAIRTGRPTVCKNILKDPRFAPWRGEALRRGYGSSIALPVRVSGKVIGALNIYAKEPDAFDPEELRLLEELANDVSYGLAALRDRTERERAEEALVKSANKIKMLFGPFRRKRTAGKVEGAGLGLAIVKEIAEQHKGRVWLEPDIKKGAAFHVSISKNL